MPYRCEKIAENNYYHIYNRGNNRQNIFFSDRNFEFFVRRLFEYTDCNSEIVAYCLMPNHFHLLVKIIDSEKFASSIKNFFISYSKAINSERSRTGHLFEGRYKCKFVPEDNYLLHLSRYIHLNPVRAGLAAKPKNWKYSSYRHYVGLERCDYVHSEIVLDQVADYKSFVESFQEDQCFYIKDLLFKD